MCSLRVYVNPHYQERTHKNGRQCSRAMAMDGKGVTTKGFPWNPLHLGKLLTFHMFPMEWKYCSPLKWIGQNFRYDLAKGDISLNGLIL